MTIASQAALSLATMLAISFMTTASAQTSGPEVTVTAPPAQTEFVSWTKRVGQNIDQQLRYPRILGRQNWPEGIADVTFICGEDGKPSNINLDRSSGSPQLDRAAVNAVRNAGSLHPLPGNIGPNQAFKARLLFAVEDYSGQWQKRYAALQNEAVKHNSLFMQRFASRDTASTIILIAAGIP